METRPEYDRDVRAPGVPKTRSPSLWKGGTVWDNGTGIGTNQ